MSSIVNWIKTHKLVVILSVVVAFLLFNKSDSSSISPITTSFDTQKSAPGGKRAIGGVSSLPESSVAPDTSVADRLVIKESNLSLLVKKVTDTQKKILQKATELGGYMVSVSVSSPQEEATATVIVRIPAKTLEQALEYFRKTSVRVISENLQGDDVTDQYVDIEKRLETLNKTKVKFEQIMERAVIITDILDVQRELINNQAQIDEIKGQQLYYEKSAEMTRVTIYLSTDELSLPYSPSESWRPQVIFKEAVRALVGTLRLIGNLVIWVVVYSVVWVPVLIVVIFLRRRSK